MNQAAHTTQERLTFLDKVHILSMRFSSFANRYRQQTGTVQLMEDLGAASTVTGPVYMLGGGNPAHIPEAETLFQQTLSALVADGQSFGRMVGEYDMPQGNTRFCRALAALLKARFGWQVTAENIAITNGSQSSFGLLFNTLAGDFDDGRFRKILLPLTPEYVGYSDVGLAEDCIFEGHRPDIELLPDRQFKYRVNFDDLTIDDRYGAVCVSRPTNPTGNVITDEELQRLASRCRVAGIPLIIDGAYGLPFPGMIFTDATPLWDDNIVLCLSLSKLGLPGLRTGIVVAAPALIDVIRNANAINSLSPGRVGPELAAPLIENGALLTLSETVIKPYYQTKVGFALDVIAETMADLPVRVHKPEGALFLWLWFEGLPITSAELYQRLVARGVYIIPGHHFYPGLTDDWQHRQECIRVNYAAPNDTVATGLSIIAEEVRRVFAG